MLLRRLLAAAVIFACASMAQAETVTNHAFAVGKGPGVTGYTSLLCTSAQLAVGQAAADPICRDVTGDVTITAGGVTAIGTAKVTAGMIAGMTSAQLRTILSDEVGTGAAYFVGGALGTPASATLTNATGLPVGGIAAIAANTMVANATGSSASPTAVAVPSCSGASQALNWTSGTGPGCTTISGGGSPTTNVQTVDYTILTSDCWKTVQVGTGSTGKKTITLPAAAGFTAGCIVLIYNGDISTRSGKLLSGFPTGCISTKFMLFPGVTVAMQVVNGSWVYAGCPGPYVPTSAVTLLVDAGGSDSTGDGFTSAFATMQRCIYIFEQAVFYPSDLSQPTCQFTSNIVESAAHYYPVPGTNTLNISASTCSFTWKPSGANIYSIAIGNDGNVQFACGVLSGNGTTCFSGTRGAGTACRLMTLHNTVIGETLSSVTCTDAGSQGDCIGTDPNTAGGGRINVDAGMTVSGTIGYIINANSGTTVFWSSTLVLSGTPTLSQIFAGAGSGTNFFLAGNFGSTGSLASGRQWGIFNNATLCNQSGNAVPGSAGASSGAGVAAGVIVNSGTSAAVC